MHSIKFDCGTIPPGFCEDENFLSSLDEKIQKIGSSNSMQNEVNLLYNDFCEIVKNEMLQKLPDRHVVLKGSLTVWALYAYFSDSQNAAFELLVWCM